MLPWLVFEGYPGDLSIKRSQRGRTRQFTDTVIQICSIEVKYVSTHYHPKVRNGFSHSFPLKRQVHFFTHSSKYQPNEKMRSALTVRWSALLD